MLSYKTTNFTVELNPPVNLDFAMKLNSNAKAFTVTSLKKTTKFTELFGSKSAENVSIKECKKLYEKGITPIATITCRDHPKNNSETLKKMKAYGVRNLLILYGDPNKDGQDKYEFTNASSLISHIRETEKKVFGKRFFCIAAAANPTQDKQKQHVRALKEKICAGANLVLCQPVFSKEQPKKFLKEIKKREITNPILMGLLPMKSEKTPAFLEKRLLIRVPKKAKKRMALNPVPSEGVKIAIETGISLKDKVTGFHIYPFGQEEKTLQIIKGILTNNSSLA